MPAPVSGEEVRRRFVEFFEARGHKHVPSSSLVPHNDPTVLLTTAGMQQMTPYFLGLEQPPAPRLVSVQKCFRTVDIDEVGDESHCTFFFMLGNFSVGDYFKRESLRWSWEFFTETMGIPGELLFPTIHPDDDQALAIWRDEIGVPDERIGRLADNWWGPVGPTGPNGPDSEIYFDRGEEFGCGLETCAPGCDCPRYLEVWNNVFMQFFQAPDGSRTPLPRQHVDTGMGLERLAMVMQGVGSLYDIDLYRAIIDTVAAQTGVAYGSDLETDRALRIIADHARGATFLIADGSCPATKGGPTCSGGSCGGRSDPAASSAWTSPFLAEVAGVVVDQFRGPPPRTGGTPLPDREGPDPRRGDLRPHPGRRYRPVSGAGRGPIGGAARQGETVSRTLPGKDVFRLYDTFGFPLDLTLDLAREQGLEVDIAGFEEALATQRVVSRGSAADAFKDVARNRAELYVSLAGEPTDFLGYDETTGNGRVLALVGPDGPLDEAEAGQPIEVILDRTPFYAESGGQIGDTGTIRTETGLIDIDDTHKPAAGLHVHRGTVAEGFVRVGEEARAEVDQGRRAAIRRNHTATHLLHRALRMVIGAEARQAGSLVAPDRLRFDFTSLDAVKPDQLRAVTEIVNHQVLADTPVETAVKPYVEAVADGAMALFGEKYGDHVRVVGIGDFSQELCGGTHVGRIGEIGPFLVLSEGSVAAGVRRIEAVTGAAAIDRMLQQQRVLDEAGGRSGARGPSCRRRSSPCRSGRGDWNASWSGCAAKWPDPALAGLLESAVEIGGVKVLAARVETDGQGRFAPARRPDPRQGRFRRGGARHDPRRQAEPARDGHPGRRRPGRESGRHRPGGRDDRRRSRRRPARPRRGGRQGPSPPRRRARGRSSHRRPQRRAGVAGRAQRAAVDDEVRLARGRASPAMGRSAGVYASWLRPSMEDGSR
jgi:alanyl-tRNA synthetase